MMRETGVAMEVKGKIADTALIAAGGMSGAAAKVFSSHEFWSNAVLVLTAVLLLCRILDFLCRRLGFWWGNARWRKKHGLAKSGRRGAGNGEGDEGAEAED
jgi:hypothetical protein